MSKMKLIMEGWRNFNKNLNEQAVGAPIQPKISRSTRDKILFNYHNNDKIPLEKRRPDIEKYFRNLLDAQTNDNYTMLHHFLNTRESKLYFDWVKAGGMNMDVEASWQKFQEIVLDAPMSDEERYMPKIKRGMKTAVKALRSFR